MEYMIGDKVKTNMGKGKIWAIAPSGHFYQVEIRGNIYNFHESDLKKNPRDVPLEHIKSQLERTKEQAEFIKKEQEKPRGLALFENPRLSKSTGLYKVGDKVLTDWVHDRRIKGIIVGYDPSKRRKYIVKIGDETHKFSEEDLDFPSEKYSSRNPRMSPETKEKHLEFHGYHLKHLQEKASKSPHDKSIRGAIRRLMDKIDITKENPRGWLNIQKVGKTPYNFMITTQDERSALGYTETFEQAKELAKELANTCQMSMEIRGK